MQNLVLSMPKDKMFSESLFEEYLTLQGMSNFEFEKEWEAIPTHPDYTVYHNDKVYIFDVKEFEVQPPPTGLSFRDPYARIREKINNVSNQFKYFKDKPCCLVLYSDDPMVEVYNGLIVLSAMYGDFALSVPFIPEKRAFSDGGTQRFAYRGKMFRLESCRSQNTTISALISLRHVPIGQIHSRLRDAGGSSVPEQPHFSIDEKQPAVIVWENDLARIQFPRDLFCGCYDERWGKDGDVVARVFAGEGVLACEKMFASES
jgi:hypothetical protein